MGKKNIMDGYFSPEEEKIINKSVKENLQRDRLAIINEEINRRTVEAREKNLKPDDIKV